MVQSMMMPPLPNVDLFWPTLWDIKEVIMQITILGFLFITARTVIT